MRTDYVVRCISSAMFLAGSCRDEVQKSAILNRAHTMLDDAWKVEYRSYVQDYELKQAQIREFWSRVHTELESPRLVYRFLAVFDQTVNPPGTEGRVWLSIQPTSCVEYVQIELNACQQRKSLEPV